MKFYKIFFFVILIAGVSFSQNYKKVKIYLNDRNNIKSLIEAGIALDHFDFEKDNSIITFLSDEEFSILKSTGFQNEVLIDNWFEYYSKLQKLSSAELQEEMTNSKSGFSVTGFHLGSMGGYMTLAEAYAELDTLKNLFPNLITTKQSLGNTIENRPVYMVKISDNPNVDENESEVLYTALHHAREPEGMMQMFYFMYYLLENYNTDPTVQYLVNNRELYFIPVVNPDGYEYNRSTNPSGGGMWRKNRRNNGGSFGVDLNRNYGPYNYWNAPNGGSSTSPSSDTYRGTAPFSEPETQIIKNFLASHKIKNALNYHTYSNLLIYPYGALSQETPDSLIFREFAQDMTRYNGYVYGTDMQTVGYSTRGNSDDFFYDGDTIANGGKIFTMTPEVGSSSDGFWPAQSRIFPLAQENLHPNLYYAWVAGEYISLDNPNFTQAYFNPGEIVQFYSSVKNKGLSAGYGIHLELNSTNPSIIINSGTAIIDTILPCTIVELPSLFSFTISPDTYNDTEADLIFTTSRNGVEMAKDTIPILIGWFASVFSDSANYLENYWIASSSPSTPMWETTSSTFYSSPSSFTDSRFGNYAHNAIVELTMKNPIDLMPYANPKLIFWTKFNIEDGRDYGQVEVSTNNGNSWVALSGKYTKSGTGTFQPYGQPLYSGIQANWVSEEIDLLGYQSNQNKIRFELKTDNNITRDGWYVDDISIVRWVPIPVELISFTGKVNKSMVTLEWQTATELNNYGFEIERASSRQVGTSPIQGWKKIGFVQGNGNSSSLKSYSFVDNANEKSGTYSYRLKQIDMDGSYKYSNIVEIQIQPGKYSLEQNYPNPFNPTTKIKFSIPGGGETRHGVSLRVYDVLGNEIATLADEEKPAGSYEVEFSAKGGSATGGNAINLSSGIYFYQLKAGGFTETKKMILMR